MMRNENTNAFDGTAIDQMVTLADLPLAGLWYESRLEFLKLTVEEKGVGELITNGDMELDANWTSVGAPSVNERSTTQKHGGTYSRKFTSAAANAGIKSDTFTTIAGGVYSGEFWVYPVNCTTLTRYSRRGDDSGYSEVSISGLVANTWNKYKFEYTEQGGGGSAAYFALLGANTYYIDDVSIIGGDIAVYHRANGVDSWTSLRSVPMYESGSRYVQHTQRPNKDGITHQFKLEVSTDDIADGMEPLSFDIMYRPLRTDTTIDP